MLTSLLMMLMMMVGIHHVAAVVAAVVAARIVCMSGRLMHLLTERTGDIVGVVLIETGRRARSGCEATAAGAIRRG